MPPLRLTGVAGGEREVPAAHVHRDRDHIALLALGAGSGLWHRPRSVLGDPCGGSARPVGICRGKPIQLPIQLPITADGRTVAAAPLRAADTWESFSGPPRRGRA